MTPDKVSSVIDRVAKAMQNVRDEIGATEQQRIAFRYAEAAMRSELAAAISSAQEAPSEVSSESELLNKHIQRCRDAVAKCYKWSPAQAEWSRARDALLNFRDDLEALPSSAPRTSEDAERL